MTNNNIERSLTNENGVKILSLFDGMACGMIAMLNSGIKIDKYIAYEIDKYAIKTATHNFPMIEEKGDVFNADFTEYKGFDFVIGGSPCTHWSIAQTKNRETSVNRDEQGNILLHSSGIGFELFSQYLHALKEAKPKYFIYENNKSMSKDIRAAITECFGFEPICINSALVSAQSRQRLYWVGKRNNNGTYDKVEIEQPQDKGILLKNILDSTVANDLTTNTSGGLGSNTGLYVEPVELAELSEEYYHGDKDTQVFGKIECKNTSDNNGQPAQGTRIYNTDCKSICLDGDSRKYIIDKIAEPKVFDTIPNIGYSVEFDENGKPIKAIGKDNKIVTIYEVLNGEITIKGKQYPIKLKDGFYIIRKLTVSECKRLQTVPEWYEFPVSNSQTYKMLGNGWTCDVISHLINSINIFEE